MPNSLAQQIATNVPYLRRFARALTGSQTSGDAYVAAVLETITTDPTVLERRLDPRTALYKAFCDLWQSVDVHLGTNGTDLSLALSADRRLSEIAPLKRQAFLLAAVEGFKLEEIAEILRMDTQQASRLIEEAGSDIATQMTTDVLIIEDEPIIAMDIEMLVSELGHRVTAVARTRDQALAAAARQPPGLVLADIQLADGSSGLDAVNDVLQSREVPVVFITAYPERLLRGEKPEPTFLITKPFQPEMVSAVISQALFFDARARRGAPSGGQPSAA